MLRGLGFEMSNGWGAKAGYFDEDAQDSELPARIHTIHTAFVKTEDFIHSFKFEGEGDTVLEIGNKVETDDDDRRIGRIETLKLEPEESLIGCEIYHCDKSIIGVRWITWCRPTNKTALDQPTESNRE